MNFNDNITKNFKWYEFFKSSTALRHDMNNYTNDKDVLKNIEMLTTNILQPLRDVFGPIKITSGYRSPLLNTLIKGSPTSNHCYGYAADIEPWDDSIKLIDIIEYIHGNFQYRELIAEYFPEGWVHVAYRDKANNRQLKLKDQDHHYTPIGIYELIELYGNDCLDV